MKMVETVQIDIETIGGFYFLYFIGTFMPQTFDKITECIFIKFYSTNAQEIHLIFDCYVISSIKDCEHQSRQEFNIPYRITEPLQPRLTHFLGSLKKYC